MRSTLAILVTAGLVTGCGAAEDTPALDPEGARVDGAGVEPGQTDSSEVWAVDFHGYGPIPLGVGFEEAARASGGRIQEPESLMGCRTIPVTGGPEGVFLMVVDGRIVRVDVRNEGVQTDAGARIGDSEERIQRLYPGAVEIQPHKYTDGHYLVITPADGSEHRLIFETDGRVVRRYRAGVLPEVAWVEGCG